MTGYPERAARLFGAVEAAHHASGTAMSPGDRIEYDRHVAAARAQMDAKAFAAAWAAGRALSLDQASAEARAINTNTTAMRNDTGKEESDRAVL